MLFYRIVFLTIFALGGVSAARAAWWNPFAENECLNETTKAAINHQTCLVHQVLPTQCRAAETAMRGLKQTCSKDVGDAKKVAAAEQKGRKSVKGDPANSAYKKITRSLERSPYFIKPERENFLPFTKNCSQSKTNYYKIGAYHLDGKKITFIVYPLGFKCASKKSISKKFPIITKQQLVKLRSSYFIKKQPVGLRPFTTAKIVETTSANVKSTYRRVAEGRKPPPRPKQRRVKTAKRYNLEVITSPENARIRILNVKQSYDPDISLKPGRYLLEISAPGYKTQKKWVKLQNSDYSINLALARENYRATRGRSCKANPDDISVSTVRIASFNKCHFLTYPDERSRDLAVKNQRESGYIHDVKLEVTYYDDERNPLNKEQYVVFRAANKQAVAPGETRFPFTGIYLRRDGVHSIGVKTLEFSVSK